MSADTEKTGDFGEILVVDDTPVNLQLLTRLLTDQGYRVRPASGGLLALRSIAVKVPDLILLDVKMPDLDGFELCRRLKSDERTRDVPVLFISALGETAEKIQGFEAGGVDFITKPIEAQEVLARVRIQLRLRELTGQLERRVRERTEELSAVNSRLQEEIVKRKSQEEALRKNQAMLDMVLNTVPQSIFWKDPEGRYLGCNHLFAVAAGLCEPEQVIGKTDADLPWLEEDTQAYRADDRKVIESGLPKLHIIEHLQQASGSRIWIDTSKIPMRDAAGRVFAVLGVYEDITERKRVAEEREHLLEQLNQAQKMESVGRLAGGVAHDFNNMLGVIIGHTEIAMEQMEPTHLLRPDLEAIHKAATRSAELTKQLLAFARKQTVAPRLLDLNSTIASMLKIWHRLIGEDIDLQWLPSSELWPVKVDPSQIDQVLANLCVNARDAIGQSGGKIIIETGNCVLDEAYCADHAGFVPGDYVRISVSDNGCGMDKETLEHVFEPFFTTKEMGRGTGLGLATVYGIIRQNEGFINVYSEPEIGSTFSLYLPRYGSEVANKETEQPSGWSLVPGTETILLVEDEVAILNMASTMLQRLGYTVLAAASPGDAIRMAQEHGAGIHLLITDVIMPEMNGRELAQRILALYPGLKRLFMSGYTADVIAHRGVLEDGVQFIQKPFTLKDLSTKIREVLEEK